ncbi:MAG: heat-inducible transcription repressor HrcA [Magnetococcales bacterium]|nr:heat-inducible transcription repressor HrcA [Magnetococcales bacterium]
MTRPALTWFSNVVILPGRREMKGCSGLFGAGWRGGSLKAYPGCRRSDMLTQRHRNILQRIVDAYIHRGEAIGSKTLSQMDGLDFSPATIRAEMAVLENMGYLERDHVSSGRRPTPMGLRFFVDALLDRTPLSDRDKKQIIAACTHGDNMEQTLTEVSRVLAAMTPNACIVRLPRMLDVVIHRVQLIELSREGEAGVRILALVVSESGHLKSRVIHLQTQLRQKDLDEFADYLSREMRGKTLAEVKKRLQRELEQGEQMFHDLCRNLLESSVLQASQDPLIVNGRMNLFGFAGQGGVSPKELARLRDLFYVLEENRKLIHLLEECDKLDGVSLFIGSENGIVPDHSCSVVAAPFFGPRDLTPGAVGVLGSVRLDYAHVIPLVDFTARVLGALLTERSLPEYS